jgi:hypothetical protein
MGGNLGNAVVYASKHGRRRSILHSRCGCARTPPGRGAHGKSPSTRVDAERAAFYRETFNVDIEQPAQFDLLINASTTTLEAATEIVIDAFAAKLRRPSVAPQSGVRSALPFDEALGSNRAGSR